MNRHVPRILLTGALVVGFSGVLAAGSVPGVSALHASIALAAAPAGVNCPQVLTDATAASAAAAVTAVPGTYMSDVAALGTAVVKDATGTATVVKGNLTATATTVKATATAAATQAKPVLTAAASQTAAALASVTASTSYKTLKAGVTLVISETATAAVVNATGTAIDANATATVGSQRAATAFANVKTMGAHDYTAAKAVVTAMASQTKAAATLTKVAGSPTAIANAYATATAAAAVVTPAAVAVSPVSTYTYSGCPITLTTAANGSPLPAADWQVNVNDGNGWTDVLDTSSYTTTYAVGTDADNTLTITSTDTMNGYKYRAVFANDGGGQVTGVVALHFAPVITGIYPTYGTAAGTASATEVITGTALSDSAGTKPILKFGNLVVPSASITISDTDHITVTKVPVSPTGGLVDVTASTVAGTSPISPTADGYTYGPVVASVSPVGGLNDNKTATVITIGGSGFTGSGTTTTDLVYVNNVQSSSTGFVSSTEITATAPLTSTAGTVDVMVQDAHGVNSPISTADQYTYLGLPTVGGLETEATGGTLVIGQPQGAKVTKQVVITGTNFVVGGTKVMFGSNSATNVTVGSSSVLTATSPVVTTTSSKTVDIQLTTFSGTSPITNTDSYIYAIAPTVTAVSVISGTDSITITGTDFYAPSTVACGKANPVTAAVSVVSTTEITTTCPLAPVAKTKVDVLVTSLGGTSTASSKDYYLPASS